MEQPALVGSQSRSVNDSLISKQHNHTCLDKHMYERIESGFQDISFRKIQNNRK